MEVGAADPPNKQPSTQRHLGKRFLKVSFKRLLSRWLSLGHLLVMGVTRDLGSRLEGRQRRCRAITEQSARFGKLVTYALPCVSSAHSPNRSPLSPALFLSPLNCCPGLGCSPPTAGLPGGRMRHPPSAGVALAALAGAGPGAWHLQNKGRLSCGWSSHACLLLLGWRNSCKCSGGQAHSFCDAASVYFVSKMEHAHSFLWLLGFPYLLLVCYH